MELQDLTGPMGSVDFSELSSFYRNRTRPRFTTVLRDPIAGEAKYPCSYDFLTLVSVACDIYKNNASDLVVMQAFQHGTEYFENSGMNCVVSRKAITLSTPSNITRGRNEQHEANVVVKRIREGVVDPGSRALKSFLAEIRVRAHEPLRIHTNIVSLRGIAWDFEDEDRLKPRPLLLEEYAPEGSLSNFWSRKNLTRMPIKVKYSLALDIANGLTALHACGVVHGDIKPENVLIFPKDSLEGVFMAKLTDFGHCVFEFEGRDDLPVFTLPYSAPEATSSPLSFQAMTRTDVYSFGLVALSLFLGRDSTQGFGSHLPRYKEEDTLFNEAMKLIEKEDREQTDSDLNVFTLRKLLSNSLRLDPDSRHLQKCVRTLKRAASFLAMTSTARSFCPNQGIVYTHLTAPSSELFIGYQTLSHCSFLLNQKIFQELESLSQAADDSRKAAAEWELCVCHFSGFGTSPNFDRASEYLVKAATSGVIGAQAFFLRLMHAMNRNPHEALHSHDCPTRQAANDKLISFLMSAVDNGYTEVLHDFKDLDSADQRYDVAKNVVADHHSCTMVIEDEERLMLAETFDEELIARECSQVGLELAAAAARGDMQTVQSILAAKPSAINEQDTAGSTPLLCAAQAARFEVVKALVQHQELSAKISNYRQQNVLHFLPNFSDAEALSILPALAQAGADFDQEGTYIENGWDNAPDLKPRGRGCPLLQTILCDRVGLLLAYLDQIHEAQSSTRRCQICESGSKFRKVVAIAIMMRRASLVEAIQEHRRAHGATDTTDIRKIEVWYNQELIPAWQLAINGPAAFIDLPESVTRAVMYGRQANTILRRTLDLLWDHDVDYVRLNASTQLGQAVVANSPQAVIEILSEANRSGLPSDWWCSTEKTWDSPLMLSIRLGFRNVFDILWPTGRNFICSQRFEKCRLRSCVDCSRPFRYGSFERVWYTCLLSWWRRRAHACNLVHVALSFAVIAAHQDHHFALAILNHAPSDLVLQEPKACDERRAHQPTSFLAQAVLANAGWALRLIVQKYPDAAKQQVCIIPSHLRPKQPDQYVALLRPNILDCDVPPHELKMSLREYILFIGTYKQCQLMLRLVPRDPCPSSYLQRLNPRRKHHKQLDDEGQIPATAWEDYDLSEREYHTLLVGLVKDDRTDRRGLWELVSSQLGKGRTLSPAHLVTAIYHAQPHSIKELLERGCPVNGAGGTLFRTPLDLATRMKSKGPRSIATRMKSRDRRSMLYNLSEQEKRLSETKLKQSVLFLQQHGGRNSVLHTCRYGLRTLFPIYYLIILPFILGFPSTTVLAQKLELSTRIGYAYLVAFIAMGSPSCLIFYQRRWLWGDGVSYLYKAFLPVKYVVLPLWWLFNNVGLPVLVFGGYNISPDNILPYLLSCVIGTISSLVLLERWFADTIENL